MNRIVILSNIKAILFFLTVIVTSPIALVAYIPARLSGRYGKNRFDDVLTRIYGWHIKAPKASSETAWLNGLRGFAAAMVMFHHLNTDFLGIPIAIAPFGTTLLKDVHHGGYINYHAGHQLFELWRLPILRLFVISGDAQVAIFFILSGFVLSWSPLRMVYSGKQEQFCNYLGSLMFRRWFRLFLPCFFIAPLYEAVALIQHEYLRGSVGQFFSEIWNFLARTEEWQRPFYVDKFKAAMASNIATWTIPWEYSGSVYLVVVLLCAGRFHSPVIRMYSIAALSIYAAWIFWWVYALFSSGIVLCDYILYHGGFEKLSNGLSIRLRSMWCMVILIGLYFLGFAPPPADGGWDIPGYQWMCFSPTESDLVRYWSMIGAVLFVTGACHFASTRWLFDTSLFQYLGRISFMLYLIHNLVIQHVTLNIRDILMSLLVPWQFDEDFKQHVYRVSSSSLVLIWLICALYTASFTFLAANWLEIYIDQPCTRFSRTIDTVLTSGTLRKQNLVSSNASLHPPHLDIEGRNDEELLPSHSMANDQNMEDSNSVSRHDP